MRIQHDDQFIQITSEKYILTLPKDRAYAFLDLPDGDRLAELFVLSSVHTDRGLDDTPQIGKWEVKTEADGILLSLSTQSSIWRRKTYRFYCRPDRLSYGITVEGDGRITDACYFGGYASHQVRWGSGFFYSGQNFELGLNPEPNSDEVNHFDPAGGSLIDLMGVPLPGKGHWFFTPPPFWYGFQTGNAWLGMGIETKPGAYGFTEFNYHGRRGSFYLSLAYEGHTQVQGLYDLPEVGFDFGEDAFGALSTHVEHVREKLGPKTASDVRKADWWSEPIFCGWGAQCLTAALEKKLPPDYSTQVLYRDFLCTLEEKGIRPGILVLDDKWQQYYGDNQVDLQKWPDLQGFIKEQHDKNRKVLLWIKAWDPEGVPLEECITNAAGIPLAVDPTHPRYEDRLRRSIRELLSVDGFDADGFKIDFTARIPSGPGIHTYGDAWGLELMHHYLQIISSEAKRTKPEALIMAHTPHPYLADLVDMIRLNDINKEKDINPAMQFRARIASIACPEAIIDTDNWPIPNKAAWRSYTRLQVELGVPSLYYIGAIDTTLEPLDAEDYRLIREIWSEHRSRLVTKEISGNL